MSKANVEKIVANVEKIILARVGKGWSKTDLAKMAGVNPSVIMRMEKGNELTAKTAKKVADALNQSVTDLFEISLK